LQKWREFCRQFEGRVDDWNMGTLLRLDANREVSDANTVIGTEMGTSPIIIRMDIVPVQISLSVSLFCLEEYIDYMKKRLILIILFLLSGMHAY